MVSIRRYKAGYIGAIVPESTMFMLEVAGTGGSLGIANGITKGVIKLGAKAVAKEAGKMMAKSAVREAARVPLMSSFYDGVTQKTLDQYELYKDADGNIKADLANPTSYLGRVLESYSETFTETYSEQFGNVFGSRWMSKAVPKLFGRKVGAVVGKLSLDGKRGLVASFARGLQKNLNWNGTANEFLEEKFGDLIGPLLTGSLDWSNFLDKEQNLITLGSVAAMGGAMQVVQAPLIVADEIKSGKAKKEERGHLKAISNPAIREGMLTAMSSPTIETRVQAVSNIDWSASGQDDVLHAIDYFVKRTEREVVSGAIEAQADDANIMAQIDSAAEWYEMYSNADNGKLMLVEDGKGQRYYLRAGTLDNDGEDNIRNLANANTGQDVQMPVEELRLVEQTDFGAIVEAMSQQIAKETEQRVSQADIAEIVEDAAAAEVSPDAAIAAYNGVDLSQIEGREVTLVDGRQVRVGEAKADKSGYTAIYQDPNTGDEESIEIAVSDIASITDNTGDEIVEIETPTPLVKTTDVGENPLGEQNDTAPLPDVSVSESKDVNNAPNNQNIPLTKAGQKDYDAMDAPMLAQQLQQELGSKDAIAGMRGAIKEIDKRMAGISKRGSTSLNTITKNRLEINNLVARKATINNAIALLYDTANDVAVEPVPKRKTLREQMWELGDYVSLEDYILRDIANGQKFSWSDKSHSKGLAGELGFKGKAGEMRARIGLLNREGPTPEQYAESIRGNVTVGEVPGLDNIDDVDVKNTVLDILLGLKSPSDAATKAIALHQIDDADFDDIDALFAENSAISDDFRFSEVESTDMAQLKSTAIERGNFMKAPNGEPTNLAERQWLQVRTAAFKEWFGDWENDPQNASKVIDENGEPLVVYHGTNTEFNTFNRNKRSYREGSFFFAQHFEDAESYSEKGRVLDVFINLRNPADFENLPSNISLSGSGTKKDVVKDLIKMGYDGWLSELSTGWGEISAFYPHQIKSATDNDGQFNSNVDDIRFSEKAERIEKLRNAPSVRITGNEITPSDDIKQYRKNALEYGKKLRGEYVNKDTGQKISLSGGSKSGGLREILHHHYTEVEHLQSIAAIPQIIENATFISTVDNDDIQKHPKIQSYQYYLCGLKIRDVDYVVKAVVAIDTLGHSYYDHRLTKIEKGALISGLPVMISTGADNNTPNSEENSSVSAIKDKRLISILQNNSSKVDAKVEITKQLQQLSDRFGVEIEVVANVDELPDTLQDATRSRRFKGMYQKSTGKVYFVVSELTSACDATATFLHEVVAHKGVDGLMGRENADKFYTAVFNSLPSEQQKRLMAKYDGNKVQAGDETVAHIAQGGVEPNIARRVLAAIRNFFREVLHIPLNISDNEIRYILFQSKNRLENNIALPTTVEQNDDVRFSEVADENYNALDSRGDKVKGAIKKEATIQQENFQDATVRVKLMQQHIERRGGKVDITTNVHTALNLVDSRANVAMDKYYNGYIDPIIKHIKEIGLPYETVIDYLLAKCSIEREDSGTSALSKKKDGKWTRTYVTQVISDFESSVPKDKVDELWSMVRAANRRSLDIAVNSGRMSVQQVRDIEDKGWKFYVPLRGKDFDFEKKPNLTDLYDYLHPSSASTTAATMTSLNRRAQGRSSKADDPIASMQYMANLEIIYGERNKSLQTLLRLVDANKGMTDMFSVNDEWFVKAGGKWVVATEAPSEKDRADSWSAGRKIVDFNLVVAQSTDTPVYRQVTEDMLIEFLKAGFISLDIFLDNSSLPQAAKLKADLKRVQQQVSTQGAAAAAGQVGQVMTDNGLAGQQVNAQALALMQQFAGQK